MRSRVSRVSIDHDEIREWAEARRAQPAIVKGTSIIRLDFPGFAGEDELEHISWDEWFQKFDDSNLALVFEETSARGQKSNFNKLIGRETVDLETGELRGPPRRRAKPGARTRREARPLRGAKVRAPKARAAKPKTRAEKSTARKGASKTRRAGA
jgi:hypothetical protein